jgi:hypothetical protein
MILPYMSYIPIINNALCPIPYPIRVLYSPIHALYELKNRLIDKKGRRGK